ncbi:hypothetical protein AWC38_SpisGene15984 [Stylophora pistillata]|uniref:Retrotransposon gag domain-containing protein n=1 Tax=Stylophora pistillata TaxID=50429 RepID=A0A2B4RTC9_STYPI|nr:hypothetical protein AWC38_SpisGene15984 [Stylophora pistillata]
MAGRPPFNEFDAETEDIESYLERLQEYFTAYDINDDEDNAAKRRAILLTSIGSTSYRVLKDLAFPDAPNTKTFDQLATLLRAHFRPTRLTVAERYRFHSACQKPSQSISEYVRTLKKLAGTCEFTNEQLNESLRDRFICGLHSEQIKQKLLSRNFTFQEAVDTAIAQEAAHKDVRNLGVVLNDGRVWKRHVDHVRRDGMGRSALEPGGEREYQDQSLEVPWAIPVRSDISGQPQVPPDAQEGVSAETDSAQDQKQDVTPAVTAEAPGTAPSSPWKRPPPRFADLPGGEELRID